MARRRDRAPLILASASPRRRQLLRDAGLKFKVIASRVSERSAIRRPRALVVELARRKALSVAKRHPEAVVLAADTIVVCGGRILGKPRSPSHSRRMLEDLNGRWHKVYTGVAVAREGGARIKTGAAVSRVKARKLPAEDLARLAGKHPDKAGGYAVQDTEDPFIEKVVGPFDNVVGLPVALVRRLL